MKILLVDDYKPTRDEIRGLIARRQDMTLAGEAETGEEAIEKASELCPDVVVMDILLPGMNGIEATRRILQVNPQVKVLALSNHFGESLVEAIIAAGGLGYVQKNRTFEELVPALLSVAAGKPYVSQPASHRSL